MQPANGCEETVVVSVQNLDLDNGSVEFDGIMYILRPSNVEDIAGLEELCDRLGVDYSAD